MVMRVSGSHRRHMRHLVPNGATSPTGSIKIILAQDTENLQNDPLDAKDVIVAFVDKHANIESRR